MKTGDVLLATGRYKVSKYLIFFQKIFYWKAKSSHVLLGFTDGIFIEATPNGGVDFCLITDAIQSVEKDWRIIRFKNLTPDHQDKLLKSSMYFFREGYNFNFIGKSKMGRSFCSELVVKIFKQAGISLFSTNMPSITWPAKFDSVANTNVDCEDVTYEYLNVLKDISADEKTYRYGLDNLKLRLLKRRLMNPVADSLFKEVFGLLSKEAQNEFNKKFGGLEDIKQKRNINFWDQE